MAIPECDVHLTLVHLAITRGRVSKLIRVKELAVTHTLEKGQRLQMLENQAAWKREGDFDRIKTITEMHAETLRRMHVGFDPGPVYTGLHNP